MRSKVDNFLEDEDEYIENKMIQSNSLSFIK